MKIDFDHFFKSLKNQVFRNLLLVGGITLAVKILAFYKETLIASSFGLSLLLDTFLIAILVPSFIQNVFVNAIGQIFIPNYIAARNYKENLASFQSLVLILILVMMTVFSLLAYLGTDIFLKVIFPGKELEFYLLIQRQLFIVLPVIFFTGVGSILKGLLEIENKYFNSQITDFISPAVMILAILLFRENLGDRVLAFGFLIGSLLSTLYLFYIGTKHKVIHLGRPRLSEQSRIMIQQFPAKTISGIFTGINPFVDQYFAAQLAVGSIAALNYGTKIPAFGIGILMISLNRVLLPYYSKLVLKDLKTAFERLFKSLKIVFLISLLGTGIIFIFSEWIISVLFERGAFGPENTEIVAYIQQITLVYVPFTLAARLIVNFLTVINENKFMAWAASWNFILNLVLNILLVKKYGVYGLALSTTIVYSLKAIIYYYYARRVYKRTYI